MARDESKVLCRGVKVYIWFSSCQLIDFFLLIFVSQTAIDMYFYNFLLLASVLVAKDRFFAWGTINLFDDDPNTSSFDVSLIPNADDGSNVSLQNLFAGDTSDDENSLFLDMNNQQGQDSSSLNDLVLGDSSCNSNLQTPVSRRLRARSDSDISSDDFCGTSPPVYKPPMIEFKFPSAIPQDLATQKELMDFFCPTAVFRGVLNTVVCSIFRRGNEPANIMEAPKWMFDLALVTVKDAFVGK